MGLTLLNLNTEPQRAETKSRSLTRSAGFGMTSGKSVNALEAASPAELFGQDPFGYRPIGPYRGLGGTLAPRDLMPPMHARMQQVAYYLYLANPLAHRIVEHMKNYVVGDGVEIRADDPAAQRVLDAFWHDAINRMDVMLPEVVKELTIFGEQCWLAAVNPVNGRVRLGYLDPAEIEAIEWGEIELEIGEDANRNSESGIRNPNSGNTAISVPVAVWRRPAAGDPAKGGRRFRIARLDEDPDSPTFGRLVGECFYFAINKARSAALGPVPEFAAGGFVPAATLSGAKGLFPALLHSGEFVMNRQAVDRLGVSMLEGMNSGFRSPDSGVSIALEPASAETLGEMLKRNPQALEEGLLVVLRRGGAASRALRG